MADKPRMFSAEHLEYLKRGIPVWPGDEERIRALVDAGKAGAAGSSGGGGPVGLIALILSIVAILGVIGVYFASKQSAA